MKEPQAVRFDMPALKDDYRIGRGSDHLERDAYERGFQSGEQAGMEMGMQKAQIILERIESTLRDIAALRESIADRLETQCVELAVGIAKKIILQEVRTRPELIVKAVREALSRIERSGQITIKIHPSLKDLFQKYQQHLLSVHPDILFDIDPSLSPYGAVIAGPAEVVVTDLDEQMRNLLKSMVESRGAD
jgi:flagellar assembly protein FliH